jgi:hypothetical protein
MAMEVHVFTAKNWEFGFTADRLGSNLPPKYGPWTFLKTIDVERGEKPLNLVKPDECLDDIGRYGFYITENRIRITQKVVKAT